MSRNYKNPQYKKWRIAVFKRDSYKCQLCASRKSLTAHHIRRWADCPAQRYEVSNGITLCWHCHSKVCGNESSYEQIFVSKISKNAYTIYEMIEKKRALANEESLHGNS